MFASSKYPINLQKKLKKRPFSFNTNGICLPITVFHIKWISEGKAIYFHFIAFAYLPAHEFMNIKRFRLLKVFDKIFFENQSELRLTREFS